jgi:hypothetical protein
VLSVVILIDDKPNHVEETTMYSYSLSLKALFLSVVLVCSFSLKANDSLSQAELDQILAPVALYPDTVLTHVLIAATYPLEVVQAARWSERNAGLSGDAAVQAVESEDWEPSVKALVAFPDLLQRLNDDLAWTQQLGEMFLTDEAAVLASIQQLRERAYQQGSLDKMKHLNVQRERQIIVIEPRQPEVIYVPYYDTRVVYGNWRWSAYPPVYWHAPRGFHTSSYFYWGPSFNVRPSFYFSIFDWHQHHIVINQHYYHNPPRYYPRRNKHFTDASRWQHDSYHRRGVHYRHEVLNRQHNFGYARQVTKEYRAQPANRRDDANDTQVSNSRERKQSNYQRRTADQVNLRQAPAVTSNHQLNDEQRAKRPERELRDNRENNRDTQVVRQREQQARTTVARPADTNTRLNVERAQQTRPEQRITPVPRQQPQVQSQMQPQRQAQQVPQVQRQAQPMQQAQPQRQMQQMQRPQVQRQEVSVSREVRGERASRSIE